MLDAARAARKLDNRIGKRFVIAGHSQGGQSALSAASMAPSYTNDVEDCTAPSRSRRRRTWPSSRRRFFLICFTSPSTLTRPCRADPAPTWTVAQPDLGDTSTLSGVTAPLYPRTLTECIGPLDRPGVIRHARHRPASCARASTAGRRPQALAQLDDPEDLRSAHRSRSSRVTADDDGVQAVHRPARRGLPQARRLGDLPGLEGVDHGSIVTNAKSADDATKYIRKRLR